MKSIVCINLLLCLLTNVLAQNKSKLFAKIENDDETVLIGWQHEDKNIETYTLQKSTDNIVFTDIFRQHANNIRVGDGLRYTDKITPGEIVYYRLKFKYILQNTEIGLSINAAMEATKNAWVIYPVPAIGPALYVRYNGIGIIDGVINILIQNIQSGIIFTRLRLASNTKNIQIPISHIGKGIYLISVTIGNRSIWKQQFVRH